MTQNEQSHRFLVVGKHPWNRAHFEERLAHAPGHWDFAKTEEDLAAALDGQVAYRYVFFLHWSRIVPADIVERYECVCFHMTDVPFGRGGSPLQNLISRGHRSTMLSALRMVESVDAGPVYAKSPLSLEGSTAEEIYVRASLLSCDMALQIVDHQTVPQEQEGEVTEFRRRKPADSALPAGSSDLVELFDHIRMLDAEGYPSAFLDVGALRLRFRRAALYGNEVKADVSITIRDDGSD